MSITVRMTKIFLLLLAFILLNGCEGKEQKNIIQSITGHAGDQVNLTGAFDIPYIDNMTVMDVVDALGGLSTCAQKNPKFQLIRNIDGKDGTYRVALDTILQPGDGISIPYCPFI